MSVELRHLRVFIAVCEARSFTHAATRMMISQPVVSQTVRQLEKAVGTELIDRSTGEARPTEVGAVLLEHARATVARFDHTLSSARSVRRPLLLGYTWSMLDSRILSAVRRRHRCSPGRGRYRAAIRPAPSLTPARGTAPA